MESRKRNTESNISDRKLKNFFAVDLNIFFLMCLEKVCHSVCHGYAIITSGKQWLPFIKLRGKHVCLTVPVGAETVWCIEVTTLLFRLDGYIC